MNDWLNKLMQKDACPYCGFKKKCKHLRTSTGCASFVYDIIIDEFAEDNRQEHVDFVDRRRKEFTTVSGVD